MTGAAMTNDVTPVLEFIASLDGCVPRWVLFDMMRRVLQGGNYVTRLHTPECKPLRHTLNLWYEDVDAYLRCMGRGALPERGLLGFRDGGGI